MGNLLGVVFKLTDAERKLIAEVMRRHDPKKPVIDYNNDGEIALLSRERVIAALRHHSYVARKWAALALIRKLRDG